MVWIATAKIVPSFEVAPVIQKINTYDDDGVTHVP